MFGEFALIRFKIRPINMLGISKEFIRAIGQGYTIRALTLD